ncbi:MFS transporter [Simiduia curdlanivorans]|uniref:MFS transporter n=1 Tax=Simiduia curdlanivorans TaxID=1492769 RepID=A0ABV8V853_9GAMM|nr:MFS transporter [Simiduia curdlanivorans]MDN3638730.1 MFS transporter [Simiduia curdlanivorans]
MSHYTPDAANNRAIKLLTFFMFLIFAMTTDAVGVIIPEVIKRYDLTLTQAATFHYGTMIAIAVSGICLGFLADRLGRKPSILIGLALFALACFLFMVGNSFAYFLSLLLVTGVAIGIFKTAALALVGDISSSNREHTSTMNLVEGFFGVGAIIGPTLVTYLLSRGVDWTYVYLVAGICAVLLIVLASRTRYPEHIKPQEPVRWTAAFGMMRDPFALFFSGGIALYVVVEAAIYVWMPTLLLDYDGHWTSVATYALSIFFIFRAAGRFLGAWILLHLDWKLAMVLFTGGIFVCYLLSVWLGVDVALWLLPLSGLFMSIVYPTLNSKGISCFPVSEHGAVAGLILFFTAVAAALGPLLMGLLGDAFGHVRFGFLFCLLCAALLWFGAVYNWLKDPARQRLNADY